MAKRNPAYGYWSEEETNWSEKDTAMIKELDGEEWISASLEEIKAMMASD